MEHRRIGELQVSSVGLGCNNFGWRLDERGVRRVIAAALDEGITFFDTADIYGGGVSEELLGRALGRRRDEVIIATKYGLGSPPGASAASIIESVNASLDRLGTDRIDLYQQHAPDFDVPVEESLGALDSLLRAGKVRVAGCSNFDGRLLDEAAAAARAAGISGFASVQNERSLLQRRGEADVLAACGRHGLAFIPYFPLASGLLTGKYRRGQAPPESSRIARLDPAARSKALNDKRFDRVDALASFAAERGHTLLELAISWQLSSPEVASVIAGATAPEQVRANCRAASWTLSRDDLSAVDAISPATDAVWGVEED